MGLILAKFRVKVKTCLERELCPVPSSVSCFGSCLMADRQADRLRMNGCELDQASTAVRDENGITVLVHIPVYYKIKIT